MAHSYSICVTCREINKPCEHEKIYVGSRWSAPKKNNDKAWRMIEEGNIWWNKRRIERPMRTKISADEWLEYRKLYHDNYRRRATELCKERTLKRKQNKVKKKHNQPVVFDIDQWWDSFTKCCDE